MKPVRLIRVRLCRQSVKGPLPALADREGHVADALDLVTVGWSVSARDGLANAVPRTIVNRVRRGLHDGAIVLMHDASERGSHVPAGVLALPEILKAAWKEQLPVVSLSSWLTDPSA